MIAMRLLSLLFALVFVSSTSPLYAASTAAQVLARMDKEAPGFRGVTASINRVKYTAILDERSEEVGTMAIRRAGKNVESRIEIVKPNPRALAFSGDTVQLYYPKINTVQEFDVSKNRGLVDQFLLLGFGSAGKDLARSYTVTAKGSETIGGVSATRLELIPKSAKAKELLKAVEIWVPEGAAYPIRQKFIEPSDDYMEVTYTEVKVNPNLAAKDVQLSLPANVKREYPQR
jgi:outer membrane lipoprotein-sorting protein